jgi:hypothetical protein
MKGLFYYLSGILLLGSTLLSCKEEVDLYGDFQETAVVYGLLDKSDTVHFIKINRAYITPGSQTIADSSYFDQVDATVTEVINGSEARVWTLQDTIISNKDINGVFYAPEQKLYYFTTPSNAPLDANGTYKLHISLNGGQFEVDGETEIISGITTSADAQNFRYEFADNPASYVTNGISVNTGNAHIINTKLQVNFIEISMGIDTISTTFDWNLGESEITSATKTFSYNGLTFYNLLKDHCTTSDPTINQRRLYSIRIISTGGSEDLLNYMTVNKPTSSLAQNKPTFTNLSVTDGYRVIGLFSSRYTHTSIKYFVNYANTSLRMMTSKSTAEMCQGPITGLMAFCSQHPQDISLGLSYACP